MWIFKQFFLVCLIKIVNSKQTSRAQYHKRDFLKIIFKNLFIKDHDFLTFWAKFAIFLGFFLWSLIKLNKQIYKKLIQGFSNFKALLKYGCLYKSFSRISSSNMLFFKEIFWGTPEHKSWIFRDSFLRNSRL